MSDALKLGDALVAVKDYHSTNGTFIHVTKGSKYIVTQITRFDIFLIDFKIVDNTGEYLYMKSSALNKHSQYYLFDMISTQRIKKIKTFLDE